LSNTSTWRGILQKKLRGSFTILQLYKLEYLVSNDHILVVPERNLGPWCLMLVAFWCTKVEGMKEIHTSLNFMYSRFPHCETHIESLHSQVLPSGCRQTDVC
jgi:hypothetical protein